MPNPTRFTPSPAMIVALIALTVALSGGAYAVTLVKTNSVTSSSIQDGQVRSVDINTNAVSLLKIAKNAVDSTRVVDGSLEVADLSGAAQSALRGATGPAGAQGPPGPSDAWATTKAAQSNLVTTGATTLGVLDLPAGSFVLSAKLTLANGQNSADAVSCRINGGPGLTTTADLTVTELAPTGLAASKQLVVVQGGLTQSSAGQTRLLCVAPTSNGTIDAENISFTAIKVGSLTATAI